MTNIYLNRDAVSITIQKGGSADITVTKASADLSLSKASESISISPVQTSIELTKNEDQEINIGAQQANLSIESSQPDIMLSRTEGAVLTTIRPDFEVELERNDYEFTLMLQPSLVTGGGGPTPPVDAFDVDTIVTDNNSGEVVVEDIYGNVVVKPT